MGKSTPGPKLKSVLALDLSGLSDEFPQRAFDLLTLFGLVPYKWQREELEKIFVVDRPPVAYTQVARKNGKTLLGVMVALVELCLYDEREIYAVSDSQTNLSSVFWLQLKETIRKAGLDDFFVTYQLRIENPVTGSFIQMRPGNFSASQGINPHLVLVDELHLMAREVWHGYLMSTDAREDGLVFAITTPGYNMDCAAFDIYNDAKEGNDPDIHATIYEPADPECKLDDEEAWRQGNPAYDESLALRKALARHARKMRENDFRRFRLGQWTATEKAWLPYGAAAGLVTDQPIPEGTRVCLALDGSWSGDTTGLTASGEVDGMMVLEVLGHWAPPILNDGAWRVDMSKVEQTIRDAAAKYDVVEIGFDPARWARNMQALSAEGLPVVEFPQSPQRMIGATTLFYDAVLDSRLRFVDNDFTRALLAHLAMAEVEESKNGAMIRKPHFVEAKANIDLAVSAIMSHALAVKMPEPIEWGVEWVSIQPTV
jgi:phage terminase large subunit-like protein